MRRRLATSLAFAFVLAMSACAAKVSPPVVSPPAPAPVPQPQPEPQVKPETLTVHATAYTVEGKTASGAEVRKGIVAADPAVLPLGSRIRVSGAGSYDGEYVVADTGRKIDGKEIDIYVANDKEAKRFGNKTVSVHILEYGSGKRTEAKRAAEAAR